MALQIRLRKRLTREERFYRKLNREDVRVSRRVAYLVWSTVSLLLLAAHACLFTKPTE